MEFIKSRKVSFFAAFIALGISVMVFLGWALDIPTLRSLFPGFPQMVPNTAAMVLLLSLSLLFICTSINQTGMLRSKVAAGFCVFTLLFAIQSIFNHIFDFRTNLDLIFFRDRLLNNNSVMYAGRMSIQTSLATLFLSSSLLLFRLPGKHRGFYIFEALLVATAAVCLLGIVGYSHDPAMHGPSQYVGLSLPSILSFFSLALGTVFLKIDQGIVKSLGSRDGAGLFLRWYLSFSILFPLALSILINWGKNEGLYPEVVAKSVFVFVIIGSLVVLGLFIAPAIRKYDEQRLTMEKAEAKAALDESEESLMRTKERLEMALQASGMGTWETDLKNDIVEFAGAANAVVGVSEPTIPLKEFMARVHPDDVAELTRRRTEAIEKGTDLNVDVRLLIPSEAGVIERWVRCKGRTKYDSQGRPSRLTGTILDVTKEKLHQQQLEEALKEAESASSLKSSFLANMSHEIRTPLGAILGFADVLNDPTLGPEDRARYLQIIQRNGETLSHLLNDILDLSKVESGHLDVEKIRFSLKAVLHEVTSLLEVRAKERGLSLEVHYDDSVPVTIVTDPMRLKQILMNLVGNALKFTDVGSVKINVRSEGKKIFFAITDTGVGIDPDKQKKLFKPFSQADNSITRIFGGTGLGLVLSRRLAGLLGGSIELTKSVVGQGSTFTLEIENFATVEASEKTPVKMASLAIPASAPTVTGAKSLDGYKILLTEDSPDIQKLMMLILKKEGAAVDLAFNGLDCLQKYQEKEYDIILMDIQMPIMDGYSAARELRKRGYKKPVIALTAHAMSDEYQRCLQAGCDGYLSKPVNRKKLVDQILEVSPRV